MVNIILPKTYIDKIDSPVIFLAGPIKGAPSWQVRAVDILSSLKKDLIIVSPTARGIRDRAFSYNILSGDENYFTRTRVWERHYLDIASKKGAILFWLPGEINHNCQKSYGAMTRLELGQAMTNYRYNKNFRFCVGSDGLFSELDTIKCDLSLDASNKSIIPTLEETCIEASNLVN